MKTYLTLFLLVLGVTAFPHGGEADGMSMTVPTAQPASPNNPSAVAAGGAVDAASYTGALTTSTIKVIPVAAYTAPTATTTGFATAMNKTKPVIPTLTPTGLEGGYTTVLYKRKSVWKKIECWFSGCNNMIEHHII